VSKSPMLSKVKPIQDHDDHEEIGPFHGHVSGQTISQWTQDWYTWALQAPSSASPLVAGSAGDGSGGFNAGKMFFLGGFDTSNGPLNVTVAHGEPILVPLLNIVDTLDPKSTEKQLLSDFKHSVTSLFASVDGTPLQHLQAGLVGTKFFSSGPTQPGSWAADQGVPVGTDLAPTKGVGYWILLQGLSKGEHTLDFGGQTNTGFSVHTSDIIHIV
jgi:hypothetical protein